MICVILFGQFALLSIALCFIIVYLLIKYYNNVHKEYFIITGRL